MQELKDRAASLAGLALERDAIYLYDRLAVLEKDPQRKAAFESIAASERRHAAIWEAKLVSLGEHPPVEEPLTVHTVSVDAEGWVVLEVT